MNPHSVHSSTSNKMQKMSKSLQENENEDDSGLKRKKRKKLIETVLPDIIDIKKRKLSDSSCLVKESAISEVTSCSFDCCKENEIDQSCEPSVYSICQNNILNSILNTGVNQQTDEGYPCITIKEEEEEEDLAPCVIDSTFSLSEDIASAQCDKDTNIQETQLMQALASYQSSLINNQKQSSEQFTEVPKMPTQKGLYQKEVVMQNTTTSQNIIESIVEESIRRYSQNSIDGLSNHSLELANPRKYQIRPITNAYDNYNSDTSTELNSSCYLKEDIVYQTQIKLTGAKQKSQIDDIVEKSLSENVNAQKNSLSNEVLAQSGFAQAIGHPYGIHGTNKYSSRNLDNSTTSLQGMSDKETIPPYNMTQEQWQNWSKRKPVGSVRRLSKPIMDSKTKTNLTNLSSKLIMNIEPDQNSLIDVMQEQGQMCSSQKTEEAVQKSSSSSMNIETTSDHTTSVQKEAKQSKATFLTDSKKKLLKALVEKAFRHPSQKISTSTTANIMDDHVHKGTDQTANGIGTDEDKETCNPNEIMKNPETYTTNDESAEIKEQTDYNDEDRTKPNNVSNFTKIPQNDTNIQSTPNLYIEEAKQRLLKTDTASKCSNVSGYESEFARFIKKKDKEYQRIKAVDTKDRSVSVTKNYSKNSITRKTKKTSKSSKLHQSNTINHSELNNNIETCSYDSEIPAISDRNKTTSADNGSINLNFSHSNITNTNEVSAHPDKTSILSSILSPSGNFQKSTNISNTCNSKTVTLNSVGELNTESFNLANSISHEIPSIVNNASSHNQTNLVVNSEASNSNCKRQEKLKLLAFLLSTSSESTIQSLEAANSNVATVPLDILTKQINAEQITSNTENTATFQFNLMPPINIKEHNLDQSFRNVNAYNENTTGQKCLQDLLANMQPIIRASKHHSKSANAALSSTPESSNNMMKDCQNVTNNQNSKLYDRLYQNVAELNDQTGKYDTILEQQNKKKKENDFGTKRSKLKVGEVFIPKRKSFESDTVPNILCKKSSPRKVKKNQNAQLSKRASELLVQLNKAAQCFDSEEINNLVSGVPLSIKITTKETNAGNSLKEYRKPKNKITEQN